MQLLLLLFFGKSIDHPESTVRSLFTSFASTCGPLAQFEFVTDLQYHLGNYLDCCLNEFAIGL